jgi:hypothetical protein
VWAGEDLSIWEVALALAIYPRAPLDAQRQINIAALEAQDALIAQKLDIALLVSAERLPARDRIGVIDQASAEQELGIFGQAHVGVHGIRLGRKLGDAPVVSPFCAAAQTLIQDWPERRLMALHLGRISAG